MPEFVYSQLFGQWQTADIKAVLLGGHIKFAAEGRKADVCVRNGCLVLQQNTDLLLPVPYRGLYRTVHLLNDIGNTQGRRIQSVWKYHLCRRRIYLLPFYRRRVASKLLRFGKSCSGSGGYQ